MSNAGSRSLRLRHAPWEPGIFPLADDAGAVLVGGPPLRALQEREASGLEDHSAADALPDGVRLACTADCVFLRATVDALLAVAGRHPGKVVQAAIKAGTPLWRAATRLKDVEGDLRLPLWAGALGGRAARTDRDSVDAFDDVVVAAVCDEAACDRVRTAPYGKPPHILEIPRVEKLGGRLQHWLDVLELSLAARPRRTKLGDVDIHPTATVINSVLEDGVKLEPHTCVIDSYLGKDVLIADHSVIHSCVIGDDCRTLVDTSLRRIVAMAGSTLSNLGLSDCVIGRGIFLTTGVATFAPPPGEDAKVDGKDTGRAVLGAAFGARCILGARALLRAGVALPPGVLVVASANEIAAKLDDAGLARAAMMNGDRSRDAY